ncbi:MAG: 23S rRNA (pseudouridine(1915)-N(3))-methyltransferase RlmH [Pseudomonadota bacterium]
MRVSLLCVANRPSGWLCDATERYTKRLPRAWRFSIDLIAPSRRRHSADERKDEEWQLISKRLRDGDKLVLLDERGKGLTSRKVAAQLAAWQHDGEDLVFVIGGPDGIAAQATRRATATWSVSPMTLPHELARLLLVEQLYRAHTLIEGHPYHRD